MHLKKKQIWVKKYGNGNPDWVHILKARWQLLLFTESYRLLNRAKVLEAVRVWNAPSRSLWLWGR